MVVKMVVMKVRILAAELVVKKADTKADLTAELRAVGWVETMDLQKAARMVTMTVV